jgi:hypothetical protein
MDGEAVKRIADLGKPTIETIGEVRVSNVEMKVIDTEPSVETIKVHTLTAIRDYLKANIDNFDLAKLLLHVETERSVILKTYVHGAANKRHQPVAAILEEPSFPFREFLDPETFVIGLQTQFEHSNDIDAVLLAAGNIREGRERTITDDGVSQTVNAKVGVQVGTVQLPSPVTLRPIRTFGEIYQPPSVFIFRARAGSSEQPPKLALIPADGNRWRLEAIRLVAEWLRKEIPGVAVLG